LCVKIFGLAYTDFLGISSARDICGQNCR
jgi:hypothetical protein